MLLRPLFDGYSLATPPNLQAVAYKQLQAVHKQFPVKNVCAVIFIWCWDFEGFFIVIIKGRIISKNDEFFKTHF